ncbi:hypothetical protein MNEG_16132, partial [Monoraphidium neglectum]
MPSENWWEDELEYDAITEILEPKRVSLLTPQQCASSGAAAAAMGDPPFAAAFASAAAREAAERLWAELGRA